MNSRHAPLPDFSKRLAHRRELIAEKLGLADAQEIGAAIDELASYLTYAWTFVRDVDRNLSIAKQRHELRRLLQGSTIDLVAVQHLANAVQVNNGAVVSSRPQENEITPNKLLEAQNAERLDTSTQSATGRTDQELEAVGAIDGTANRRRKASG